LGAVFFYDRSQGLLRRCKEPSKSAKPRQWEIYRTGRTSAIQRSKAFFETVTEVSRAGKRALCLLLSEYLE
jgi:hypothetical protein